MKWQISLLSLCLLGSVAWAQDPLTQEPLKAGPASATPVPIPPDAGSASPHGNWLEDASAESAGGFLTGNHNFDHFIGFMSNPLMNIDPRAATELIPITGFSWFSTIPALPSGDLWIPPAAGLTVALSERLAVGLNQGGYAVANFSRDHPGLFRDRFQRLRDRREFAGEREGWLNLGGFGQYTLIEDVPCQFLLTAGLRWEAPMGSKAIFQGRGPANLSPYLTAGKELGDFHVLADLGFQFPTGSGGSDFFYGSVHFDRQFFGWLYPLVEFNWIYHSTHVDIDLPDRIGFINLGDFESSGNIVTLAAGANAVLIPSKLELGAVYTTAIASQRNLSVNGFLVKMVLRY
jgi:hypothetical protein